MLLSYIYWYIAITVVVLTSTDILRRISNYRFARSQPTILLELTPPASSRKTPLATEQLFSVLHHLGSQTTLSNRLLGRFSHYTFEIVSSRHDGIRYLVSLPLEDVPIFEQQLVAYLPGAQFKEIEDYLHTTEGRSLRMLEFKQAHHFAYPLAAHDQLAEHDPVAYISGSMTHLAPDELVAFQLVLTATSPREVTRIRNKLVLGQDTNLRHKSRPLWLRFILFLISLPILVLKAILAMISEFSSQPYHATSAKYTYQPPPSRAYSPTPASQVVLASLSDKLAQPLFQTSLRAVVFTDDNAKAAQTLNGLTAALSSFHVPGYQGFNTKRNFPRHWRMPYRWTHYAYRLPGEFQRTDNVLSVAEVASLYHFPYGDNAVENVITTHNRTLPAPAALKALSDKHEYDVILGENKHHGTDTPIGLTPAERERHVYVIGGTGNGKTTMLQYAIVQDIQNGKGVAIVDPHGDLAETILQHIPEDRVKDVIYFNPSDIDHPIALNLLELPNGLTDSELALEQDFVTEAIVSLFRKTFSEDDSGGHRIEYILRNTIRTAYTIPDATLFTLYDLLTDTNYRNSITQHLEDRRLKQFWHNEFAKAGNMQRVKMTSGVTTKLGRYDSSAVARGVIEQTKSTVDFDNILASGKILICNFAKGSIGEDTAELFGTAVLTKLQLAALRRVRLNQRDRRPYYLYVDEFQHFATHSFLQMLSEARKYKLFLTMAEQSTAQQEEQRLVHIILDNVGTVVCFRVRAASEKLLLPIFQPKLETGEIANLPAYHYYVKIAGMETREPLSGETLVLGEPDNPKIAQKVIAASRRQYATKVVAGGQKKQQSKTTKKETEEVEDEIAEFEPEQQPVLRT